MNDDRHDDPVELLRRELLRSGAVLGGTAGLSFGGAASAWSRGSGGANALAPSSDSTYVIEQGGTRIPLATVGDSGTPIEEIYDASDDATPTGYEEEGVSKLFLVERTDEPGLGVVHDRGNDRLPSGGVVDDFEDGDLDEYSQHRGGSAAVTSTRPFEGSHSLELTTPGGGGASKVLSTSGLERYPEAGDVYRTRWYRSSSDSRGRNRLYFGVQDAANYYEVYVNYPHNDFELRKFVDGNRTTLASANETPRKDTWVDWTIDWGTDGTITATYDDGQNSGSLTATDDQWTEGGVGFYQQVASGGVKAWFDDARIVSGSSTVVLDGFEDGDVSEYAEDADNTGPASFRAVPASDVGLAAPEGSTVGQLQVDGTLDGWWTDLGDRGRTIQAGDRFGFHAYNGKQHGTVSLTYWRNVGEAATTGLTLRLEYKSQQLIWRDRADGSTYASADQSLAADTWYWVEVEISDDGATHTAKLYDERGGTLLNSLSAEFPGGQADGIEWRYGWWNLDGTAYVDGLELLETDRTDTGGAATFRFEGFPGGPNRPGGPTWVVEDELTSYLPDEGLAHWQWGASEAAGGVLSGALPGEDGLTIRPSFGDSSGIDDWQVLSTGTGSTSGFSTDFEGGLADAWQDAADFGTDDGDLVASGGGKMWREQSSATGVFEVQDVQNTASYTGIRSAFVAQETKYDGAEGYGLRWIQHRNDSNDEDYWSGDIRLERLDSPADKGPTTLAKLTADHDGRVNTVRVERTKTDESDDGDEEYTFEWTLTYADGTTKSGTYVEGFDETSYTESDYWVQRHDSGGASQRVGGISVEGRDGVGWTSLSTEDPVTIRTEVSRDLQTYVGYKRDKIERIRNITTAMFADYDTPKDPASVDSAAERYLDNLEPRLDEMGPDEARLHMEVLQRLNAGERVSLAALNAVNAELGLNDQTVVEQFADAAVDALSSFMMGKLFERVARVGRAGSSSATRKLIQSSTFEDFVTGLNRQVDSVFFGSTFGDEFYERIVRTVKRDQLAFYHLWEDDDLGGSITNLYQTSIKHGGSLPSFDEGGNLAGASFFTQVEKMLDEAKRYVERTTYESAVFRDDGIPNQMPVEFGPVSRELPNIPDAVPVPYADEAEDAANTVLGWIEETAESAGEIKELPSVNIEQLEDPEIDLPDEIPLPDAWSFPEEVGIDRIEIDAGRAINQVDELIPLGYSGVGAELAEEVTILVDKVREGELDRQPAEIRSKLVSLYVDFYEQLVAGMEVMFTGYDVMRKIGDIAERIALGVAGVTVLVVSMLSLIGFGAGLVLVPVLAIYVEIIGLLNVVVAAVEGITGYAFLATAMTGHSASVTKLLNADLKRLEEVL